MIQSMKLGVLHQQFFQPGVVVHNGREDGFFRMKFGDQFSCFVNAIVLQHFRMYDLAIIKKCCLHSGIAKIEAKRSHAIAFSQRWGKSA